MYRSSLLLVVIFSASNAAAQPATYEQQTIRDIAYYDGPDADPVRHRLDIHVPRGRKDFPVLFFIHGGGWTQGNKDHLGIYTMVARTFNRHGIGVVSPNYRLSPGVKHPEHIRDVARAFAWTYKNIRHYGGDSAELFVAGHSAGGHLAALLATDETYLKAEGLSSNAIRGALPLSGVFSIPPGQLFDAAFGQDEASRKQASPLYHVRRDLPPFLILFADRDLPACDRAGAEVFCAALRQADCRADLCEIPRRNHLSILWSALNDTDPVMQSMLGFIMAQVTMDRLGEGPAAVAEFTAYLSRYVGFVAGQEKAAKK